jgi:hypothetical protein
LCICNVTSLEASTKELKLKENSSSSERRSIFPHGWLGKGAYNFEVFRGIFSYPLGDLPLKNKICVHYKIRLDRISPRSIHKFLL